MKNRAVFPLRMSQNIRRQIRDRAVVEHRTQTNLILEAVEQYLATPVNFIKIVR